MKQDLFTGVSFNLAQFRADMRRTGARRDYAIFFTPRSGSSWLTDALWRMRRLGRPEEWFNPSFVPKIARSVNADSLMNYVKMLKRKQAPGGLFGFEITYYQLSTTFGGEESFLSYFPPQTTSFMLVREDIVLQAVSLAKSVASSIYHSASAKAEEISRADAEFAYDPASIRYWLNHILDQETRFEAFFARHGITPLRLSYERMMAEGAAATVDMFAARLGVTSNEPTEAADRHRKIGTDKNTAFAARFAAEHDRFLAAVAERRAVTLGALAGAAPLPCNGGAALQTREVERPESTAPTTCTPVEAD